MEQNKFRSYFFYAIGEIALVMIGILLALQVNNWNEDRKSDSELRNTLRQINLELEFNIKDSERVVNYYISRDSLAERFLSGTVNGNNFDPEQDGDLLRIMFSSLGFEPNIDAIDRLLDIGEDEEGKLNQIISELKYLRTDLELRINNAYSGRMTNISDTYYEYLIYNTDWFSDFYNGGLINPDITNHFFMEPEYKNSLARYRVTMSGNYARLLRYYYHYSRILHGNIAELIKDENSYEFAYRSLTEKEFEDINREYVFQIDNDTTLMRFKKEDEQVFLINTTDTLEAYFTNKHTFYVRNGIRFDILEDGSVSSKTGFGLFFKPHIFSVREEN